MPESSSSHLPGFRCAAQILRAATSVRVRYFGSVPQTGETIGPPFGNTLAADQRTGRSRWLTHTCFVIPNELRDMGDLE